MIGIGTPRSQSRIPRPMTLASGTVWRKAAPANTKLKKKRVVPIIGRRSEGASHHTLYGIPKASIRLARHDSRHSNAAEASGDRLLCCTRNWKDRTPTSDREAYGAGRRPVMGGIAHRYRRLRRRTRRSPKAKTRWIRAGCALPVQATTIFQIEPTRCFRSFEQNYSFENHTTSSIRMAHHLNPAVAPEPAFQYQKASFPINTQFFFLKKIL